MVVRTFALIAIMVSVGFFSGTHLVENDVGQSFCLGAFFTGLTGAIVLLVYTKFARFTEQRGQFAAATPSFIGDAGSVAVSAGSASSRPSLAPSLSSRPGAFRAVVERPAESAILNNLAMLSVLFAAGFLGGTYLVENDLGQSFCLGAFSTGLAGSIILFAYTKIARVAAARRLRQALSASEARFRSWIEHAGDMITVMGPDGTIKFESPSVRRILGYEPSEIVGETLFDRVHPDDAAELREAIARVARKAGNIVTSRYRFRHKNGTWRTLEEVRQCMRGDDGLEIVANVRDISERQAMEDALRASEERFRDFADTAADYLWEADAALRLTYVSERFQEKTGLPARSALGSPLSDLFEIADSDGRARLESRKPYVDLEIQRRGPDGVTRVFRESGKPVFSEDGSFLGYRGTTRDVTDSHVLSQKLSYQASHDVLTGLINRRQFDERLERVIDSARHNASEHVLCYIDLDQFKVINDTCGHVAGDHMLRQMATLLKERVRIRDTVARLGGDEFAVLMEHCTLEQGERVASTLHEAVDQFRFTWNEAEFKVGVSMGLVPIDEASGPITDVLSAADSACYIAKDQGRNRIHVYRKDDVELAKRQGEMQWVGRLNRALDENRLLLYRQLIAPLNDASANPGAHFEILLRLRDDEDGIITASKFLPAAERYGLSSRLDQWVVRSTFEWLSRQPAGGGELQLCSINLSGHSLASKTFTDFVLDQVQTGKVATDRICFEITETAAIENLGAATRFMGKLAGMGCQFALDDFGSGLSSFAYLKTLPVQFLKIDGFFVSNIASNPIDREMVKSIHEIGRLMGKRTIAEYADKPEVIDELRRIGVDYAQGYEIGRPQPLE